MSSDLYSSSDDEVVMTENFESDQKDVKKSQPKYFDAVKSYIMKKMGDETVVLCEFFSVGLFALPFVLIFGIIMIGCPIGMVHPMIYLAKMGNKNFEDGCKNDKGISCTVINFYYNTGLDLQCIMLVLNSVLITEPERTHPNGYKFLLYVLIYIYLLWLINSPFLIMLPSILLLLAIIYARIKEIAENEIKGKTQTIFEATKTFLIINTKKVFCDLYSDIKSGLLQIYNNLFELFLWFFFLINFCVLFSRFLSLFESNTHADCNAAKHITSFHHTCVFFEFYLKNCIDLQSVMIILNFLFFIGIENKNKLAYIPFCGLVAYILINFLALKYINSPLLAMIPVIGIICFNVFLYVKHMINDAKTEIDQSLETV